jgi:hypothetical protein
MRAHTDHIRTVPARLGDDDSDAIVDPPETDFGGDDDATMCDVSAVGVT